MPPFPRAVVIGLCCVCGEPNALVMYCKLCRADICGECRGKYFDRGMAAVKRLVGKGPCSLEEPK